MVYNIDFLLEVSKFSQDEQDSEGIAKAFTGFIFCQYSHHRVRANTAHICLVEIGGMYTNVL